jgi:hypothetical protein
MTKSWSRTMAHPPTVPVPLSSRDAPYGPAASNRPGKG